MKKTMTVTALCTLLAFVISCGKKEEAAAPAQSEIQKQATTAATEVQKAAETQAAAAQKAAADTAQKAASAATPSAAQQTATQAAQSATSSADAEAKSAIAKAQSLMAEKKYAEALSSLKSVSGQNLSPDLQSMISELIKKIQTAMAGDATSKASGALGGLLGGKK
jgi:vacuolar-type H+-ATPase subunit E/Vma4